MSELTDEQYGHLSRALNDYCFFGTEPELTGIEKALFIAIRPNINSSVENKISGKKGGAPQGNKNASKTTQNNLKQPPLFSKNNPPCKNETTYVDEEEDEDVDEEKKEEPPSGDSVSLPLQTFPDPERPPDKPSDTREDATAVFQKARALWNDLEINPQCRDLIIPPSEYACLRTFQNYSPGEILNAVRNYHWHTTKAGEGWAQPPPYGSIYGFLKTGVARYYDDKAFEQQFRDARGGKDRERESAVQAGEKQTAAVAADLERARAEAVDWSLAEGLKQIRGKL
jgi:hypothetical protein